MKKLTTALCAVLLMILVLMPGAAAAGPVLSATRAYCIIDADTGLVLAQQNMNEDVGHFPQLAGPLLGFVEIHVLGLDVNGVVQAPALNVVLIDPVAHRPAPLVVFDPAHDAVSLVLRLAGGHVQFVHLNGLQLERDQPLLGVAV